MLFKETERKNHGSEGVGKGGNEIYQANIRVAELG